MLALNDIPNITATSRLASVPNQDFRLEALAHGGDSLLETDYFIIDTPAFASPRPLSCSETRKRCRLWVGAKAVFRDKFWPGQGNYTILVVGASPACISP